MDKKFAELPTSTSGHYRVGFRLRYRCNMGPDLPANLVSNNDAVPENVLFALSAISLRNSNLEPPQELTYAPT